MTPEQFQLVSRLFESACRLDADEVEGFLREHCGHDTDLERQVRDLLRHDATPLAFGEGSSAGAGAYVLAQELAGGSNPKSVISAPQLDRVGRCRIVRTIASGGMGTVYEAVQDNPERTVAIKILRRGIASPSALRRFEYEAAVLSRLRHPAIAQIHEAGTHDDDGHHVPYFVMEHVTDGQPITRYARSENLTTASKLALFVTVCDAVHHGHQKGIIHRDLKPGNILVDRSGQPRVIDFGIARSTDADVALTTQHTEVGQLVGTLQYMSPEQCQADPHDLDTRSDVYSLGLVLYELLCGSKPYDVTASPLPEAVRLVRDATPPRLSHYGAEFRGDLETIVHKALHKDRVHRYASASELRQDIERYLDGRAIAARPPSAAYQMRCLIGRHKALFASLGTILVILIAAVVFSSVMYMSAHTSGLAAKQAEQSALQRKAQAEAVTDFLSDMLASSNPMRRPGEDVRVRDLLDRASEDVAASLKDQPLVEATLRATIARAYMALTMPHQAQPHADAAFAIRTTELDSDDLDVAESLGILARLNYDLGNYLEGTAQIQRALSIQQQHLGQQHTDVAQSLLLAGLLNWAQGSYAEAENDVRTALNIQQALFEPDHPEVSDCLHMLGLTLRANGQWREGEEAYRRALALRRDHYGPDHPKVATTLNNLAVLLRVNARDYAAAVECFREALRIRRRALGPKHEHIASTLRNLGRLLLLLQHFDEAEALLNEALEMRRELLGSEHPYALNALDDVSAVLTARGDYATAEPRKREALALAKRRYGDKDLALIRYMHNLAWTLAGLAQYDEAEELYLAALRLSEDERGPDHGLNLTLLRHLLDLHLVQGHFERARAIAENLMSRYHRIAKAPEASTKQRISYAGMLLTCSMVVMRDADHALAITRQAIELAGDEEVEMLYTLMVAQNDTGDVAAAQQTSERMLALIPDPAHDAFGEAQARVATVMESRGDWTDAEPLRRALLMRQTEEFPEGHGLIGDAQLELGVNLIEQHQFDEAVALLTLALDSHTTHLTEDHWRIAEVRCAYGAAVAGQGHDDEAERLLQSCARLASRSDAPYRRRTPALRRLVLFLESHGRTDEAAPWRRVLEQTRDVAN
jgi:serine/threonine protein kinase/Tfp pilus assembly protein PilF